MDAEETETEPEELQAPDELVITLRKPIVFADTRYDEIKLREPTAGEMEKVEAFSGIKTTMELIRVIAAVPDGVVKKIVITDLRRAADYFLVFTQGARWKPEGA
jgi:hypothetical protein